MINKYTILTIITAFFTSAIFCQDVFPTAKDITYLEDLYKHLHANPELSFKEVASSKRMAEELRTSGFTVTENIGGYGVVGVLKNGEGPTVLVRADMDALPIVEATSLPYASKVKTTDGEGKEVGVMHACGHDMHMTVWAGTARNLAARKNEWSGTLVFIGQPAEERSGGAKAMLADGLYEKFPKPDYALALHVSSSLPAGQIGLCAEYAMANVDMVDITVFGHGGHGAYPHTTIDPIVLSARLILDFQTIISREISPLDPGVLTVGSIHGGAKGNVIPNEVKLELTLRSYKEEVRTAILDKIKRTCRGVGLSAGLHEDELPIVTVRNESTPALFNDKSLVENLFPIFQSAIGEEQVLKLSPVMGGEDFGRYGRTEDKVPILLYWLGSVDPEVVQKTKAAGASLPSLHSSKYAPLPAPTIRTGVATMTAGVLHLLKK